jgi:hypothetical protein
LLKRAIEKHGKENFFRETLKVCNTLKELNEEERKLITPELLNAGNCYNIAHGGQGGYLGEEVRTRQSTAWTSERKKEHSDAMKKRWKAGSFTNSFENREASWNKMNESARQQQAKLMSRTLKACWADPEYRKKMSKKPRGAPTQQFIMATKDRKWMHLNGDRQLVQPLDIKKMQDAGWFLGMGPKVLML